MDFHDKLIALQRRTALPARRVDRPTVAANLNLIPQQLQQQQQPVASTSRSTPPQPISNPSPPRRLRPTHIQRRPDSPDEFDRRPPASLAPSTSRPPQQGRLYNPNFDSIPTRQMHRDQDVFSEASSAAPVTSSRRRPVPPPAPQQSRQLFDHRRDDPVRFAVLTRSVERPPPPGGYVSASSTSDAQSLSSNFTLTSGTTSSSASTPHSPASNQEHGGASAFLTQFKKVYRQISDLENKIKVQFSDDDDDLDMDRRSPKTTNGAVDKWAPRIALHKCLAEADHRLLTLAMRPQVPSSLQSIPSKYNIPMRLWNNAFQHLLQSLRIASATSPLAQEHLLSFIYFAYGFYTTLLEEENLSVFKDSWIEALGDLARYQMTVAATVSPKTSPSSRPFTVQRLELPPPADLPSNQNGGSPLPSVGAHAAAELEVEDEKELWRRNAREWYSRGIKDTPGTGRLHHHLGLLCRDMPGEELQATYHFVKGLVASHPLDLARESILPIFSLELQNERYQPSSSATSIFLLMQGMLITKVQLDDFHPTLARFFERLQLEPGSVSETEWIMMAVLNIGAALEYGRPEGVIRRLGGLGPGASQSSGKKSVDRIIDRSSRAEKNGANQMEGLISTNPSAMDSDRIMAEPETQEPEDEHGNVAAAMEALSTDPSPVFNTEDLPYTLRLSLQLMFDMLSYALKTPFVPSKSPFRPHSLNPYITIVLTFLTTLLRHEPTMAVFERSVPWAQLATFLTQVAQQTSGSDDSKSAPRLIGSSPLPEDWCLRGMEWVGRRVYERGFWRPSKAQGGIQGEMDVILPFEQPADVVDGIVEDEDEEGETLNMDWNAKRWKRLRWSVDGLVRSVKGLDWVADGRSRKVVIGGVLQQKVDQWRFEREREEELERQRRDKIRWRERDDEMDVDEDVYEEEDDEDDENDSPDVRALKERRRYLRNMQSNNSRRRAPRGPRPHRSRTERPALQVSPGYSVLVCDTNILLSSLPNVEALIASERFTVVLPLAVVTELDGLSNNSNATLAKAASDALNYLIIAIKTQSTCLKIQTSKGNYLSSLSIRSEDITFARQREGKNVNSSMDDLILRTAIWQADHFMDRSSFLSGSAHVGARSEKTSKVILMSFDRNLRLKARARQLDAADERDMAVIFSTP